MAVFYVDMPVLGTIQLEVEAEDRDDAVAQCEGLTPSEIEREIRYADFELSSVPEVGTPWRVYDEEGEEV